MSICTARQNLRAVTGFGLALTLASLPAAAQQWTPRRSGRAGPEGLALPLGPRGF
jgi:hypothetical protein